MNGIINVYKEKGFTSFDVVAKLRGILKTKKIGHTGTLDPDAEGVLPVCIGKATRLCEYLTEKDKIYQAVLFLGATTDTLDASGTILSQHPVEAGEEQIKKVILGFLGKQLQIPPMYSALKVDGKKLCDLARKGIEVERKAREIEVFSLEILWVELPRVSIRIHCSKGTYIRSLCQDIGEKLGCGGYMETLLREKSGRFDLSTAYRLGEIEERMKEGKVEEDLIPLEEVLIDFPRRTGAASMSKLLQNGSPIEVSSLTDSEGELPPLVRMYTSEGSFIGLYAYSEEKKAYRPKTMFL